jgi:DNA-binding transcriptional LysR family regulator
VIKPPQKLSAHLFVVSDADDSIPAVSDCSIEKKWLAHPCRLAGPTLIIDRMRSMEMQQIRYFLAAARTLNFTRAAQECHVAQPSLTRAIQQLESELGGDLFRRERKFSHLTELGQRILPLLRRCQDTAQDAKLLATAIKRGEIATLRIGLSDSVDLAVIVPQLLKIDRAFNGLELKFLRGNAGEIVDVLKRGEAEIGIAGPLDESWSRFDVWPLFTEPFALVVNAHHRLAHSATVSLEDIAQERLLCRHFCERWDHLDEWLRSRDVNSARRHEVTRDGDVLALVEARVGVAIVPRSLAIPSTLTRRAIRELALTRTVFLYAVAGRPRSRPAAALVRQMSGANWTTWAV